MIDSQVQQDLGRAKNALQDYLIRKLLVPKIYLDADWKGTHVDVLAIDRAGVGDVHAVRMIPPQGRYVEDGGSVKTGHTVSDSVREFRTVPAHFRYVAVLSDDPEPGRRYDSSQPFLQEVLAEDGVGRIGILYVNLSQDDPSVRVLLKPERFRSSSEMVQLADQFVAEHTANWEIRE